MKKSIIRNIIILVAVLVLAVVGYKLFFSGKSSAPASDASGLATTSGVGSVATSTDTSAGAGTSTSGAVGQDFLTLLLSVQSIKLDDSIFQTPAFQDLQDYSRPIPPDTDPGRPDPFAPLGQDGTTVGAVVSTSNPSSITTTSSMLNGSLSQADSETTRWFEYGTTQALGTMTPPTPQVTPGAFAQQITGLLPNTTYYVQASAIIGGETVTGNTITWQTAQGGTQKQ